MHNGGLLRARDGGEQPVTPLELFFDLVYVFAVTQLSHRLLEHLTIGTALETLLLLLAVWSAWVATAWAISADLIALARAPVPVISVIIGEGGSGGALAMCVADYVGMMENSYLSVIAPEACASIIFRDSSRAAEAAEALRLTARDLKEHGIVDEVLPEPLGGAHNEPAEAIQVVSDALDRVLTGLAEADSDALIQARYERYRRIGAHVADGVGG